MSESEDILTWDKFRFGNRVVRAKRMTSGNWQVTNDQHTEVRAVTHEEFIHHYERVPDSHQSREEKK